MSPDARLIAAAILTASPIGKDSPRVLGELEMRLLATFPDPEPLPGIRGMVPVAYLKDILFGAISRLEASPSHGFQEDSALDYLKRRLADVENL